MIRNTPISIWHQKGLVVLAVWCSNLLRWEHSPDGYPSKGMSYKLKLDQLMMHHHGKQQTKQVFTLSWAYLANPVPWHTEVPCSCVQGLVLCEGQQCGMPTPCAFILLYPFSSDVTGVMQLPSSLIHHHVMLWWCPTLLGGNWHACIQLFEWKSFTQSMCLHFHTQTSWSQKLWPQVHTITLSPRYLGTFLCWACQDNNLLSKI